MQKLKVKSKSYSKESSFTLLELLIVIAIIAILAAVVLIALNDAKQSAWEARGLQFSQNIKSTLGADLVGEWTFDEGSGGTVRDSSGNNNHGTWNGTGSHWSDEGIVRKAGQFNGSDDYVSCGNDEIFNISGELTIETWIYPTSSNLTYYRGVITKYSQLNNKRAYQVIVDEGYSKYLGQGTVQFWISSDGSTRDHVEALGVTNQWQHIIGTYDGSSMSIFVNGELKHTKNTSIGNIYIENLPPLMIGSDEIQNRFFRGLIDEVRIYKRALTAEEIQKRYAETKYKYLTKE